MTPTAIPAIAPPERPRDAVTLTAEDEDVGVDSGPLVICVGATVARPLVPALPLHSQSELSQRYWSKA